MKRFDWYLFLLLQFYHHKSCPHCNSVPKEPSLCLVCGTIVCLRENCCKGESVHEAVQVIKFNQPVSGVIQFSVTFVFCLFDALQHSIDCGAGTAIFLGVNSSFIIVIRGKRACLWGSVYLDAFGEEDRELKSILPFHFRSVSI